MEKTIVVNENDEEIGTILRKNISNKQIYRISSLWITNSKNEILLAKRAFTKKSNPGKWGPAVAGTNEEGETYESNIYKEASEEIGLTGVKFTKSFKQARIDKKYAARYFNQWFKITLDKDVSEFRLLKDEVAEIRWFTKNELFEMDKNQFVGALQEIISKENLWKALNKVCINTYFGGVINV
jgi:isopentenyldiphosphate isomerase